MWIEIIAIGDELLSGETVNQNAAYMGQVLKKAGYLVSRHTVLSDEPELLEKGVTEALTRSDLILTTGGLGPTLDDLSKNTIAELFDKELILNEEIEADLKKRFGDSFPSIHDQASIPEGIDFFMNAIGTAPGLIFQKEEKTLIMLPGVPREMHAMFEQVIPWVEKSYPISEKIFSDAVNFCLLPEGRIDPVLRELQLEDVSLGIYPHLGFVKVLMSTKEKDQPSADRKFEPIRKELENHFSEYIYPSENGRLEEAVHEKLIQDQKTLILGESCSGGALAECFTKQPASSMYFLGSCVAYSNEMKQKILQVPEETLQQHGAVSKETVQEMLKGLFAISSADYAVAISGTAGPSGGTTEKPVGTVFIGVQKRGEDPDIGYIQRPGERGFVVEFSVNYALGALWRKLSKNLKTFDL